MKSLKPVAAALFTLSFVGPAHADKTAGNMVDDSTINATIKAELIGSKETKANRINVETYKGVVQLSGFVTSDAEKEAAGRIAKGVDGVRDVHNSIGIGPDTGIGQKLDDSLMTGKVKAALIDTKGIASGNINVETRAGVVQLSGFVPTEQMREKAGSVAMRVPGVKKIDNVLLIRPE